jgi:hypothetical protein
MARRANRWIWVIIASVPVVAPGVVLWYSTRGRPYNPPSMSFDGSSDRLQQTVIVPTLDSPIPEGKSAIWCVSFQLAWNHLLVPARPMTECWFMPPNTGQLPI